MTVPGADEYERFETVRIGAEGASEMDQDRRVIFVPRSEILRIELVQGSGAERPVVVAVLGLVFAVLAVGSLLIFVLALSRGGVRIPSSLITGIVFLLPAWWLLDLSLRKRWFLRVHTRTGMRKLVFHQTRDERALREFVATARRRFGLS
jgi:hypothetical protein